MGNRIANMEPPKKQRGFEELKIKQVFPLWYCVKTLLKNSGKVESDFVRDEKTNLPIAIQSEKKPLDGVFEDYGGTTYYTYHEGYAEAARQVAAAMA